MAFGRMKLMLVGVLTVYTGFSAMAQDRVVPSSRSEVQLSYSPVVKSAAPAVVNIYTKKVVRSRRSALFDDPLFKRFFGDSFSFGIAGRTGSWLSWLWCHSAAERCDCDQ